MNKDDLPGLGYELWPQVRAKLIILWEHQIQDYDLGNIMLEAIGLTWSQTNLVQHFKAI